MHLCTLYPAAINISAVDPLCPSCDPEHWEYEDPPLDPLPKPADAHEFCNWDGFGCHYYDPNYCENHPEIANCSVYTLCEGGRCLATSLPPPGKFFCSDGPNCDTSCIGRCHWEFFEPNDAGGYGACYFQNTNVCVRNDWGGSCDMLCNAACCPGG